ncbi:MAG TPA: response regulator [Stenotrophomonas sp.]|nr:response regulator [Stenotrophomonas sp.]
MWPALAWVKQRLARRPDSEHAQNLIRIVITALFMSYLGWRWAHQNHDDTLPTTWLILLFELTVAVGLMAAILARPQVSHVRRWIGMCTDYVCMGAIMSIQGEPAAPLYAVCMWVTIGNGMRYGSSYLRAATALGGLCFLMAILLSPYWQANPYLAWGLLLGLIAIPLYFDSLLHALTRAVSEARHANEAKSRFLANMSHEFRTPLNGLSGMTEVLATTELDSEQRECLGTIQASARSLLSLVEEVLDISAIEAGKVRIDREDFSLRELVAAIGLILLPQARSKGLDYRVDIAADVPDWVTGDPGHLRQVLLNLAGNAVKFTHEGFVLLRVRNLGQAGAARERTQLRFEIVDTGIGVPPAMRARLFDAFEQADVGLARRYEGTGLGTTIAKGLVEAMGGSIGHEEHLPRGSLFWFEMPIGEAGQPAVADAAAGLPASASAEGEASDSNVIAFSNPFLRHRARVRSMRILVADDHEANRMVLQRLLEKAGHRVVCVNGAEQVLDLLSDADFDAVIVDLHMPGMSGLDMLKQLRVMQASGLAYTPVMVLSADVTPDSIRRCQQAGAYAFLAKPVMAVKLLDTLGEIAANGRIAPAGGNVLVHNAAQGGDAVLDPGVLDELAALGMGEGFEQQFIAQCMSDTQDCMSAIAEAGEAGQWERLREQAHALRGVASNLGLVGVANGGGELMRMPDWQVQGEWRQRLTRLREQIQQGRAALDARTQSNRVRGEERTPRP